MHVHVPSTNMEEARFYDHYCSTRRTKTHLTHPQNSDESADQCFPTQTIDDAVEQIPTNMFFDLIVISLL